MSPIKQMGKREATEGGVLSQSHSEPGPDATSAAPLPGFSGPQFPHLCYGEGVSLGCPSIPYSPYPHITLNTAIHRGGQDPPPSLWVPRHSGKPATLCAQTPTHLVHHQVVIALVFITLLGGHGGKSLPWPSRYLRAPLLISGDRQPRSDWDSGASEAHVLSSERRCHLLRCKGLGAGLSWRKMRGWNLGPKTCCGAPRAPPGPPWVPVSSLVTGWDGRGPGLIHKLPPGSLSTEPVKLSGSSAHHHPHGLAQTSSPP